MTAADAAAVITAVAGLVVAVTALIHSIGTRSESISQTNEMKAVASGIARQRAPGAGPDS